MKKNRFVSFSTVSTLHTQINIVTDIPTFFSITKANVHDVNAIGCIYMQLELDFCTINGS